MIYRTSKKSYGFIVEQQERKGGQWRRADKTNRYTTNASAGSRMRALRKVEEERPSDAAARIMASKQFCVI